MVFVSPVFKCDYMFVDIEYVILQYFGDRRPIRVSHSIIQFLDFAHHSLLKSTKSEHDFQ
jgi:hypothetical protein